MSDPFPCPRCGRPLEASGEGKLSDGRTFRSFQCTKCTDLHEFDHGPPKEIAYTFVVLEDGTIFDPHAEPE